MDTGGGSAEDLAESLLATSQVDAREDPRLIVDHLGIPIFSDMAPDAAVLAVSRKVISYRWTPDAHLRGDAVRFGIGRIVLPGYGLPLTESILCRFAAAMAQPRNDDRPIDEHPTSRPKFLRREMQRRLADISGVHRLRLAR